MLYAGETQINLQVPVALGSKTSANLVVTVDAVSSVPFPVTLSPAWPAIFAHGVLNEDNRENTGGSAARPGSILQIFATGIPKEAVVSVQFAGRKDLAPLYAGEAPSEVARRLIQTTRGRLRESALFRISAGGAQGPAGANVP